MPARVFVEGRIEFRFDDACWEVEKWDEHPAFTGPLGIRRLNGGLTDPASGDRVPEGTKAVDFVGLSAGDLYLFEVKDFRGYAAVNARRQEHELPLEIGLKVRDTITGLLGAHRMTPSPWLERVAGALRERTRRLHVIAWIVEDAPRATKDRRVHIKTTGVRSDQLQQRLSWCTRKAWADDPLAPSVILPGVQARTLRGQSTHSQRQAGR
jgi:hypothetical protein